MKGRLSIVGAGLFCCLLAAAGPAPVRPASDLPGLGDTPRRADVNQADAPWTALARLNVPGVSRCTAVMIAPRLALTAAHCIVSRRLGHAAPAEAVHVVAGYRDGEWRRHSVAAGIAIAPGFDINRPDDTRGADVALVTLVDPVIDPAAALPLAAVRPGQPAVLGGYSQDREERITADTHCQTTGYGTDGEGRPLLGHNCAGTKGTSGAALLDGFGAGWRITGIEVGAFEKALGGVAVPSAAVASFFGLPLR